MTRLVPVPDDHLSEDRLIDLALGESASPQESQHVDDCDQCREGLESYVHTVAVTREAATTTLTPPPSTTWSRIRAEIDDAGEVDPASSEGAAADSQGIQSPTGRGDGRAARGYGRTGRRPAVTWLAAACIAGLLVGVGGSQLADRLGEPDQRTIASAELDTLDTGESRGVATVEQREGRVSLEVSAAEVTVPDGYAEVWLINRDGKRMVSVGVLDGSQGAESFPITQDLLDQGYVVVDISHEAYDDQPEHSGDSLVRGPLTDQA